MTQNNFSMRARAFSPIPIKIRYCPVKANMAQPFGSASGSFGSQGTFQNPLRDPEWIV
jgi:hypothetical protein